VKRREFITGLAGAAVVGPRGAWAQQSAGQPIVGFLQRSGPIRNDFGYFLEGLQALGYEDRRNIRLERRYAYGDSQKLRELADELARLKPVAIVVDGSVTIEIARDVTPTIPIVAAIITDPERFGITQLSRPAGNLTGLSTLGDALSAKRLELIKEMLPQAQNVAVLRAPPNVSATAMQVTSDAAKALGLNVQVYDAGERSEWPSMFAQMTADNCHAMLQFTDARFAAGVSNLVVLAVANRLPAVYGEREFVDAGGLASYGINFSDQWRRTAGYVDKIIKGATTRELPIEQPTRFALVVNINTARALNLSLPPALLGRADEVIE